MGLKLSSVVKKYEDKKVIHNVTVDFETCPYSATDFTFSKISLITCSSLETSF